MNVQKETLEKSQVKLTIEVGEDQMKTYRELATKELQDKVKVDGFRPGHIPMDVLVKQVGEQAFLGQVLDLAISESYEETVRKEGIRPVAYPKINIVSQEPLKYEATIPVLPELKWKKDVSKLMLEAKKIEIKKEDVEAVFENLKKRSTTWEDVDREAKKGDRVEVDFDGFDMDGVPLDGTSSKNHPVVLGEGSLIPGFEDEIVGMKKEEEKDFEITFPKDYHSQKFQGKKVKFHVKVNRIEEGKSPELTDEFAKEITGGNRQTVQELTEEVEEELRHQKEEFAQGELEQEFLKELVTYVDVELPEALVEREIDFMIAKIKEDAERRKMKWEDYEAQLKEEGKDMRKELEKPAQEQVMLRLALEKLHEEEKTEVTEEEVEKEIDHMLSHYPAELAPMLRQRYEEDSQGRAYVKNQVMLRKLVQAHTKSEK